MSEFFNLESVMPVGTDEVLLIRGRQQKRATVGTLAKPSEANSAIAFSQTPPTDKKLWFQLDDNDLPIELWLKRTGGLWVSDQVHLITAFDTQVKSTVSNYCANPLPDEALWIETLSAKGYVWDWQSGNSYDAEFSIYLIDKSHQMTQWHYLRLSADAQGQMFNLSEPVERLVTIDDALSFMLRTGLQGKTKLKSTAASIQVRRVYAEN